MEMPSTRIRRFSAIAATGLSLVLAVSACGSSPSTTAHSGSRLSHIVVGQLSIADTVAVEIARKEGYFRQQGLDVTTVPIVQSTQAIPLLLHGTIDITAGNYVNIISADVSGVAQIKVVAPGSACGDNTLNVLALPGSKISGAAGLAGKSVAVNIDPDIQTLTINAVLTADGVNPGQVKYVEVPFPDMGAALKAGRVDAISETEPFITGDEETDGAVSVLPECQGPTAGLPIGGFYSTAQWLSRNQQAALAFQRAVEKAQAVAATNPKLVAQLLPTYTSITPGAAARIALPGYPTALDLAQIQRVATLMFSGGMLKKPFNVASMLFHPSGAAG
jgi:NitT/TauT family transport system substrate-binding protein